MYKNPRLKHVKEIKEICSNRDGWDYHNDIIEVLNQCNLLLETKKKKSKKKFFVGVDLGSKDGDCTVFGYKDKKGVFHITKTKYSKPSPQPEIKKLYMEGDFGDIAPSNEEITFKLNQVIDQLNKLTKTK